MAITCNVFSVSLETSECFELYFKPYLVVKCVHNHAVLLDFYKCVYCQLEYHELLGDLGWQDDL